MTPDQPKNEWQRFGDAFRGIGILFARERHARFHLFAALAVCLFGIVLEISRYDWLMISIAIGLVIIAEAFNTAIEKMCDIIQPAYDIHIRNIKDIAAGAVLLSVCVAIVIGVVVFLPYLSRL